MRSIQGTLRHIEGPLQQFFPSIKADVRCDRTFDNRSEVFGIVDASPIFIQRLARHQEEYYSGKYRRHCTKVQALVTPDEQYVHLSKVYRGNTHDKAIFDRSGLAEFVSYRPPGSVTRRQRIVIADLGYLIISRASPGAILPHKRPARGELTSEQKHHNRILSRDRILVENVLARWKTLFGICHEVFRGEI
jgi:hypothetical protein